MSDVFDTELFSAYLDGELTAEEQVRAEQILATSPEARQMLDELRAVGSTLQGLPQQKLGEDLSARVLQVAERRMLSPDEPEKNERSDKPAAGRAAATMTTRDAKDSEGFPWREISWRGMLSPRALIWSAIVIIVAVIIHFSSPRPGPNRDLAKLDGDKTAASKEREHAAGSATSNGGWIAAPGARPNSGPVLSADKSVAASDSPTEPTKAKDLQPDTIGKKPGSRGGSELDSQSKIAKDARPAAEAAPAVPRPAARIARKQAEPADPGIERPANEMAKSAAGERDIKRDVAEKKEAAKGSEKLPAAKALVENEGAPESPMIAKAGAPNLAAPAMPAPLGGPVAQQSLEAKAAPGKRAQQATMVVCLNVSADAARRGLFKDLLLRNNLEVVESMNRGGQSPPSLQGAKADNSGPALGMAGNMPLSDSASSGSLNRQQQVAPPPASEGVQNGASRTEQIANGRQPVAAPPASEGVQNGASRAEQIASNNAQSAAPSSHRRAAPTGTSPAAPAPQVAAAGQVVPQGANAVQSAAVPEQSNLEQSNNAPQQPMQTAPASNRGGAAANGEPSVLCYECDASREQVDALMKQIDEQSGAFALAPPAAPAPLGYAVSKDGSRPNSEQDSGAINSDETQRGDRGATGKASGDQTKDDQAKSASSQQARQLGDSPRPGVAAQSTQINSKSRPAGSLRSQAKQSQGGAANGQSSFQYAAPAAAPDARVRVRFVLKVVDRIAPPPAAAAASRAAMPPAASVPPPAPVQGK